MDLFTNQKFKSNIKNSVKKMFTCQFVANKWHYLCFRFSVTTAAESIIQNDPQLDAEFLSHVTAEEVWKHYTE